MRGRFFELAATVMAVLVLGVVSIMWAAQSKTDVTGMWTFTVQSAAGTSTPMLTFKQEGEKLTGHYSSQLMGEAQLTGSVRGQALDFTVSADVQGTKVELKYSGTIESNDSMKGKLSAGEFGDGTFTGKRKE